jgi:hypothetical protein
MFYLMWSNLVRSTLPVMCTYACSAGTQKSDNDVTSKKATKRKCYDE